MAEGLETTHSESTILDDNSNGIPLKTEIDETNEEGNNIVAAAMMKLPADQLAMLREDFKNVPFGLSLYQFVSVMLKYAEQQKQNSLAASQRMGGASPRRIKREEAEKKRKMELEEAAAAAAAGDGGGEGDGEEFTDEEISAVADLVELFHQVDVNGDNAMEWDEFTGFIINMAMAARSDVHFHDHWHIRSEDEFTVEPVAKDRR